MFSSSSHADRSFPSFAEFQALQSALNSNEIIRLRLQSLYYLIGPIAFDMCKLE